MQAMGTGSMLLVCFWFIILPGIIAVSHKVILQLTTFQIHPEDTSPKLFPCWSFAIYFLLLCFLSQQVFNLWQHFISQPHDYKISFRDSTEGLYQKPFEPLHKLESLFSFSYFPILLTLSGVHREKEGLFHLYQHRIPLSFASLTAVNSCRYFGLILSFYHCSLSLPDTSILVARDYMLVLS